MGAGFYQQVVSILKAHGCYFIRQGHGSHEIWYSPIRKKKFPVAYTIASRNMANVIFKQAGIKEKI